MNLDIIKLQTTWNDAAGSINSNYAKIADAIAQLKANGGGGGADIDLTDYATKVWVEAKGYITASALTPYAKTADVSITYATIASVQGFENRIGGLEGAVPQLDARVTTVEGKVSSLNETVSTGKNNLLDRVNVIEEEYATKTYVDNAIDGIDLSLYLKTEDAEETYATKDFVNNKLVNYATIVSVTAIQNTLTGQIGAVGASVEQLAATKLDSSYFTLTNIKSTLGISDWALAVIKPSYAWSEITSRPTALSQFTDDVVAGNYLRSIQYSTEWDANAIFNAGIYSGQIANLPSGSPYGRILSLPYYFDKGSTTNNFVSQLFITNGDATTTPNEMYFRTSQRNSWNVWNRVITDKNIGNYNAGSATKLETPRTLWGQSFDGTNNISGAITLGGDLNNVAGGIYIHKTNEINSFNGKLYLNHRGNGLSGYGSTNDIVMVCHGGKVGIGLLNPEERLHVNGTIKSGNLSVSNQIDVQTIVGKGFGLYSSDTNPHLELNQNGKIVYLQMVGDNGMVALGSIASKSLVVNAAGFVSVNRGYVNPTEALDVGGNIKASGNISANSITINGVTISSNGTSITVNGNVLATGDITGGM